MYARVSTKEQNLARQLENAKQFNPDKIFEDKQSGKNFNREAYQEMKSILVQGDTVIVSSLDRLGRNKEATKEELRWYKSHGILLRVLDLPTTLIEYPKGQEWIMEMINNILIEVMSTVDEQELVRIKKRQREGIDAMPVVNGKKWSTKRNKAYGRPITLDEETLQKIKEGISYEELGISRATWYRHRS